MSTESQNEKERNEMIVKRIDFEHGSIPSNILNAAIPMLVAQLLSLLLQHHRPHLYSKNPAYRHNRSRRGGLMLPNHCYHYRAQQPVWHRRCPAFFHPAGENNSRKASEIMNTSYTMVWAAAQLF